MFLIIIIIIISIYNSSPEVAFRAPHSNFVLELGLKVVVENEADVAVSEELGGDVLDLKTIRMFIVICNIFPEWILTRGIVFASNLIPFMSRLIESEALNHPLLTVTIVSFYLKMDEY